MKWTMIKKVDWIALRQDGMEDKILTFTVGHAHETDTQGIKDLEQRKADLERIYKKGIKDGKSCRAVIT